MSAFRLVQSMCDRERRSMRAGALRVDIQRCYPGCQNACCRGRAWAWCIEPTGGGWADVVAEGYADSRSGAIRRALRALAREATS